MVLLSRFILTLAWLSALVVWGVGDWRFWLVLVSAFWLFPAPRLRKRSLWRER